MSVMCGSLVHISNIFVAYVVWLSGGWAGFPSLLRCFCSPPTHHSQQQRELVLIQSFFCHSLSPMGRELVTFPIFCRKRNALSFFVSYQSGLQFFNCPRFDVFRCDSRVLYMYTCYIYVYLYTAIVRLFVHILILRLY